MATSELSDELRGSGIKPGSNGAKRQAAAASKGRDKVTTSLRMPTAFRLLAKSSKKPPSPESSEESKNQPVLTPTQGQNESQKDAISIKSSDNNNKKPSGAYPQTAPPSDVQSSSTTSLDSKTNKDSVATPVSTPSSSRHQMLDNNEHDNNTSLLEPPTHSKTLKTLDTNLSVNSAAESDQADTNSSHAASPNTSQQISQGTGSQDDPKNNDTNDSNGTKVTNVSSRVTTELSSPILSLQQSQRSAVAVRSSMDLSATSAVISSDRDRYGFKKKTNYISESDYDKWWAVYQKHLRRRKRKWVQLMKENGLSVANDQPQRFPAKSEKLKRYIRKGIPAEWRGNAWWWYAKGPEKLSAHAGMYDSLCKQTLDLASADTDLIERDLNRTFPDNIYFREDPPTDVETPLISALRRVLRAFSVYMPSVGYCQSLNFIAGMFLLFMEEEKAFWMLVIITQRYLPGMHEVTLEGVNIEQGVLILCIKDRLPEMWGKIRGNFDGEPYDNVLVKLPPITLCTASWFMSAYVSVLPVETMLRVWDSFFFEDSKIFFRIALTLLKMSEPSVRHLQDQMDIIQVIQNYPKKMLDAALLMENCFKRRNGFEKVSQEEIVTLRQFVGDRRKAANVDKNKASNSNKNKNPGPDETGPSDKGPDGMTDLEAYQKLKRVHTGRHHSLHQQFHSMKELTQRRDRTPTRKESALGLK